VYKLKWILWIYDRTVYIKYIFIHNKTGPVHCCCNCPIIHVYTLLYKSCFSFRCGRRRRRLQYYNNCIPTYIIYMCVCGCVYVYNIYMKCSVHHAQTSVSANCRIYMHVGTILDECMCFRDKTATVVSLCVRVLCALIALVYARNKNAMTYWMSESITSWPLLYMHIVCTILCQYTRRVCTYVFIAYTYIIVNV